MRNLLTAIFGVLLIALAGTEPAQSGDVTFKITNKARSSIMVKAFSRSRGVQWPAPTEHWTLDDSVQHPLSVSCQDGEKVCFGASSSNGKTQWGVGFKGNNGCRGCCLTCGTNVWHALSLVERAASPTVGGMTIDPGSAGVPADD